MASLLPTSLSLVPAGVSQFTEEGRKLESDNLKTLQNTRKVIDFPVADGTAYYVVVTEKPLTLQHVEFCDGYKVHPALIRGLTLADVNHQLEFASRLRKLFSK